MDCGFVIGSSGNQIRLDIAEIQGNDEFSGWLSVENGWLRIDGYCLSADLVVLKVFYESLKNCYETLQGKAWFAPFYDGGTEFSIEMLARGSCCLKGEVLGWDGRAAKFEYAFDQSYLLRTLQQLRRIVGYIDEAKKGNKTMRFELEPMTE